MKNNGGKDRRTRRRRLALVLGLVVAVLWAAWRTESQRTVPPGNAAVECVQGRQVERDAQGTITKITRGYCE